MVNLQINQQFGRLGLTITPFQYDFKITKPDFQLEQKSATISLEQPAATLEIDYTQSREAIGYNGIETQQRVFSEEAKSTLLTGIERRVAEGNQLGDIRAKAEIGEIAYQASQPQEREFQLVSVPPPQIKVNTESIQWTAEPGGVFVNSHPGTFQGELRYGSVSTYLEQTPSLQMKALGTIYDQTA